jgi:hypothetical protein
MLRRIIGIKRYEITGDWRKLHNEENYNLYSLSNIISDHVRDYEMGRECGTHGEKNNAYIVLVGKPGRRKETIRNT